MAERVARERIAVTPARARALIGMQTSSAIAGFTFLVTLSFLVTTPGVFAPDSPIGGFLMKDLILLGAALYTAGEAQNAS